MSTQRNEGPTFCEIIIALSEMTKVYGPVLGFAYRPEQDAFEPGVLNEPFRILTRAEFEELVEYCNRFYETHSDEAVAEMNDRAYNDWAAREQLRPDATAKPSPRMASGFVYLVRSDRGYYKIGKTKNPKSRQKTFGLQLPFEIEFVHLIESNAYHWAEEQLHRRFAAKRVQGEWFALSDDDVVRIKSLARLDYTEG
jgi:hypothetical protein